MRANELIRGVLDLIDKFEHDPEESTVDSELSVEPADENHFKQIEDLLGKSDTEYSNSPDEKYAGIEAVTVCAGGGVNGPKHPADIRADSVSMYPGKVFGAK
jgi:hypothetical protein